jgi:hypothetical protein
VNSPHVRNSRVELYSSLDQGQGDCCQLHSMSGIIEENILAEKVQLHWPRDAFTPGSLQQYGRVPVGKWMYVIDFVSCVAQRL